MALNGRLNLKADLVVVQITRPGLPNMRLAKRAAVDWKMLKIAAKKRLGRTISIASPGGAYRSWNVQSEMFYGSRGNVRLAKKWGLNPRSSVPLAGPGTSSPGVGTRVDIVGTAMDESFLHLAKQFGFTREFGPADPNHFIWKD